LQPTDSCCSSCWIEFCSTQYNTTRTFCPCRLLSSFLRSMSTKPPTTQTACQPLDATLWINTLPFLIPVDWLVSYGSQHHLLLFIAPCSLRHVGQCSFPYISFAVTSTGFVSERCVATVSRLAYMDSFERGSVGLVRFGHITMLTLANTRRCLLENTLPF
jgi:hypothetical protein